LTALVVGLLALSGAMTGCGSVHPSSRAVNGPPGAGAGAASEVTPSVPAAGPSTPAPPPVTTAPPEGAGTGGSVSMQKSGGIAGVMQSVNIAADGSWVYTDRRSGMVRRGNLTSGQRQQITSTLANPALVREASKAGGGVCNDGFVYSIISGQIKVRYASCGGLGNQPALMAVIRAIEDATPM
jgi:hypothetical protein